MRHTHGNTQRTHDTVVAFNARLDQLAQEDRDACGHPEASLTRTERCPVACGCGWYVPASR